MSIKKDSSNKRGLQKCVYKKDLLHEDIIRCLCKDFLAGAGGDAEISGVLGLAAQERICDGISMKTTWLHKEDCQWYLYKGERVAYERESAVTPL